MATNRTFQAMLNEYLPNSLLKEELLKREYILNSSQKDDNWKGGKLIVPFKSSGASSVRMGKLTAASDIAEDFYVRGSIDDYVEAWGSMKFQHRDILEHDGKVNEESFLKLLPDTIEDFMEFMKMCVSIQLGTGPHFATATVNGTVGGVLGVDRIDRFCLRQKVTLLGTGLAVNADFYVIAIDINADTVTLSATRGGAAADISAYTVAAATKVYTDDADVTSFTSVRSALLSAANGGSATLHGVTKLSHPFLQAVNIDGSAWAKATILDDLFDAYTEIRKKARGRASEVICSYTIGGAIMKAIENKTSNTANYNIEVMDRKASLYGWDEIILNTVKGKIKIVMIQEWDDDIVWFRDPKSHTFRSNGFFRKRMSPDGDSFFEVRAETGYEYIVDQSLFGEMEYTKPGNNGMVYGIQASNF